MQTSRAASSPSACVYASYSSWIIGGVNGGFEVLFKLNQLLPRQVQKRRYPNRIGGVRLSSHLQNERDASDTHPRGCAPSETDSDGVRCVFLVRRENSRATVGR